MNYPPAMDIARLKLTLVERLMLIWDEGSLQRLEKAIETEVLSDADEMSDEEYAELNDRMAKHERGETKYFSAEESIKMIRQGTKG